MPKDDRHLDFADIRKRADFRAILANYGLTPVGKGDQVKILCPFHPDEDPSCSVNLATRVFNCFSCHHAGNVLDFVHRMETLDGTPRSLRHSALKIAELSGIDLGRTGAPKAARKPQDGPSPAARAEGPSAPQKAPQRAPGGQKKGTGEGKEVKANKPLGFSLTLDSSHPYLAERGIPPELVESFGLGYCGQGIMAGRVCIPIHDADGRLVAYAGRWVGAEDPPEGKGKYELPAGFRKELELFNLHRAKHCKHLVVVEGFFDAIRLLTVMLDGDEPGRAAAGEVAAAIGNVAWTRIVHLPDGAEPDTIDPAQLERLLGRGER
jgi:DNA primase